MGVGVPLSAASQRCDSGLSVSLQRCCTSSSSLCGSNTVEEQRRLARRGSDLCEGDKTERQSLQSATN